MKTLILGMNGIGKTTFIQNEIIPTLPDYTVIDVCQEYNLGRKENLFNTSGLLPISYFKTDEVDKHIQECLAQWRSQNHVWILDGLTKVYNKLNWLRYVDNNIIVTFNSIDAMQESQYDLPDIFNTVYMFPTQDAEDIRAGFMLDRMRSKTKIIEVAGRLKAKKA